MLKSFEELKISYREKQQLIKQRLREFKRQRTNDEIFAELCFCLCTPQSRAKAADKAIKTMAENKILLNGNKKEIAGILKSAGVRFPQNKAKYIINARKLITHLQFEREWLVKNIKGLGYKEASHFLRNIGFSGMAILDRHILKNLLALGAISKIPKTLTRKKYLEIEQKMKAFSQRVGIPLDELDLLLWSEETSEIFK